MYHTPEIKVLKQVRWGKIILEVETEIGLERTLLLSMVWFRPRGVKRDRKVIKSPRNYDTGNERSTTSNSIWYQRGAGSKRLSSQLSEYYPKFGQFMEGRPPRHEWMHAVGRESLPFSGDISTEDAAFVASQISCAYLLFSLSLNTGAS